MNEGSNEDSPHYFFLSTAYFVDFSTKPTTPSSIEHVMCIWKMATSIGEEYNKIYDLKIYISFFVSLITNS